MSIGMVLGMDFMQYIVVGVGLIQRIPGIPGPRAHNPQKFIVFFGQLGVKSCLFIISIKLNTAKITSKKNIVKMAFKMGKKEKRKEAILILVVRNEIRN